MAGIQIIDPLRVDYGDANALMQSGMETLLKSPIPFQTEINANQQRHDDDVLGMIQGLAMKYGPDSKEFQDGMAQTLLLNPNAYVPEQSIVTASQTGIDNRIKNEKGMIGLEGDRITNANAGLTGIGLGIDNKKGQLDYDKAQGMQEELAANNAYMSIITNPNSTAEELAVANQIAAKFQYTSTADAMAKRTTMLQAQQQLDQNYALGIQSGQIAEAQVNLQGAQFGFDAGNATYGGGGSAGRSGAGAGAGNGSFTYPQTGSTKNLGSLIQRGESGGDSYNAVNYGNNKSGTADLSKMTYGQVVANQKAGKMLAVGKYQFHAVSLKEVQAALPWLKSNTPMTPEVQDRIFAEYYLGKKRPAIADYIRGKSNNLGAAADAFASEWASAEGTNGKGKYKGNSVTLGAQDVASQLQSTRAKYNQMIRAGASDAEAMRGAALYNNGDTRPAANQVKRNPNSYLKYSNTQATRNQRLDPGLEQSLGFLADMGITYDINSGGQSGKGSGKKRVGSTAHDHGNAADGRLIYQGRVLDWNKASDLPILKKVVEEAAANGINGIGAGYMGKGTIHFGKQAKGATWGGGGTEKSGGFGWVNEAVAAGKQRAASGGSGAGGMPGFGGVQRENRFNPLGMQAVSSVLGDGSDNPILQNALKFLEEGRLSGRDAAASRMSDDAVAFNQNLSNAASKKAAEQGPAISLPDLFGEENKGHIKDYFKLQNMDVNDFNNASTKEQKEFLSGYVKFLESTSDEEYKGIDRAQNPTFIPARGAGKALTNLKKAYAVKNGDKDFLSGKPDSQVHKAQKQKTYPYNVGIDTVDKMLKSTSLAKDKPSPYDKMLTPVVIDTAVKEAMSDYRQYLVDQMSKEGSRLLGVSKYSTEKFDKGYVVDRPKLESFVTARINGYVKREQGLREGGVNKVNLKTSRTATIRNIKSAIASRK